MEEIENILNESVFDLCDRYNEISKNIIKWQEIPYVKDLLILSNKQQSTLDKATKTIEEWIEWEERPHLFTGTKLQGYKECLALLKDKDRKEDEANNHLRGLLNALWSDIHNFNSVGLEEVIASFNKIEKFLGLENYKYNGDVNDK